MADIARAAGVSMATASRALSGARGVSSATTERVRRVADELAYVVSPEASNLSRRTTGRVGVLTTHISRWFFGEVIEAVERTLSARGIDTLVYGVGDAEDRRRFFDLLPARRKVDAIIVVGMPVTRAERERLELLDVAVVAAGGQVADYPFVSIDDEVAGRQAMDHLLLLGHRRIAMIDAIDPNEAEWPVELRSRAYSAAIAASGADADPELFVQAPWGPEGGAEAMAQLLSLPEPPTAVFAHSDEMAFGALRTLRQAGLEVPRDMSVIGIDDHPFSSLVDLTTIRQDARAQGVAAARAACAKIDGADVDPVMLVPTRLVPRGSTAAPRRGRAE